MSKFKSFADWGVENGGITEDTHETREQAIAILARLQTEGMGGDRKVFPLLAWYCEAKEPPVKPGHPLAPPSLVDEIEAFLNRFPKHRQLNGWKLLSRAASMIRTLMAGANSISKSLDEYRDASVSWMKKYNTAYEELVAVDVAIGNGVYPGPTTRAKKIRLAFEGCKKGDKALQELADVDGALGNRSIFDGCKTRSEKILLAIKVASSTEQLKIECRAYQNEASKWKESYLKAAKPRQNLEVRIKDLERCLQDRDARIEELLAQNSALENRLAAVSQSTAESVDSFLLKSFDTRLQQAGFVNNTFSQRLDELITCWQTQRETITNYQLREVRMDKEAADLKSKLAVEEKLTKDIWSRIDGANRKIQSAGVSAAFPTLEFLIDELLSKYRASLAKVHDLDLLQQLKRPGSGDTKAKLAAEAACKRISTERDALKVALIDSLTQHLEVRKYLKTRIERGEYVYNWQQDTEDTIEKIEKVLK